MSILGNRAVTAPTDEERQVSAAIADAARPMLNSDPQMVHFPTLARAALSVITGLPRVPRWRGRRTMESEHCALTVDVDIMPGGDPEVRLTSRVGDQVIDLHLTADEAAPFFLDGLAACAAVKDPSMIDPMIAGGDCATALGTVSITEEPSGVADDQTTDREEAR